MCLCLCLCLCLGLCVCVCVCECVCVYASLSDIVIGHFAYTQTHIHKHMCVGVCGTRLQTPNPNVCKVADDNVRQQSIKAYTPGHADMQTHTQTQTQTQTHTQAEALTPCRADRGPWAIAPGFYTHVSITPACNLKSLGLSKREQPVF